MDHDNRYEDMDFDDFLEQERHDQPATEAEAHLEWHRNSGVPVGQPCPWDACDPDPHADDFITGYPTEMDYLNSLEADDYRNEMSDLDG